MIKKISPSFTFILTLISLINNNSNSVANASPQSVQQNNKKWVSDCLNKIPPNKVKKYKGETFEFCKKPNYYFHGPMNFQISQKNSKLVIEYKLRFQIVPNHLSDTEAQSLLDLARACAPMINSIWSRYDITLNVAMDSNRHPNPSLNSLPSLTVNLINSSGRSDAMNFYRNDQDSFCKTMTHEVGHHLGLEDEYGDLECPDRPFVSTESAPYSFMANYWPGTWENTDFYERHIRWLFSDYCSNNSPANSNSDQQVLLNNQPINYIDLGTPY